MDFVNLANYEIFFTGSESIPNALEDAGNARSRESTRILRTTTATTSGDTMKRDEIGGFPYEAEKIGDLTVIRFYPRPTAKYPDQSVLTLKIDAKSKAKLLKILT